MVACIAVIGVDHALAAHQPEGGYAAAKKSNENGGNLKTFYAEGNGFEVDKNGMTLCDMEVGVGSASLENEYATMVPYDCLTASATAEIDWSGAPSIDISAVASIYSPSIEIVIPLMLFNITVEAEAYIGGVGAGLELDSSSGKIKVTPPFAGVGSSYCVDFDLAN